jgi:hypothetical protein
VPDQVPPKKPKNYKQFLDMLNTKQAAKMFSPKTYVNLVGEFSRKAYDNGELSEKEYMKIVRPLFGDAGIMASKKIQEEKDYLEKYADGGRIGFLKGGDTKYNKMVTEMYIQAGGQEGTGMDIDSFAEKYFKKFNQGGRVNYNSGSQDPEAEFNKRVIELMDDKENPLSLGEAVRQAMKESRENNSEGTMPKSEKWMRDYFFSGKGGYDDRMSYKEFAEGPGQELFKRFGND